MLAGRLQRAHQRQLLGRQRTRHHVEARERGGVTAREERIDLFAREDARAVATEADLAGHRPRGVGMIARHHDHLDPRLAAARERVGGALANGIFAGEQPFEAKAAVGLAAGPGSVETARSARDHLVAPGGELVHAQRPRLALDRRERREREHDLGGALGGGHEIAAPLAHHGGLAPAVFGEGEGRDPLGGGLRPGGGEDGHVEGVPGLAARSERARAQQRRLAALLGGQQMRELQLASRERPRLVRADGADAPDVLDAHGAAHERARAGRGGGRPRRERA